MYPYIILVSLLFFFFFGRRKKRRADLKAEASLNNLLGKINSSEGVGLLRQPQPRGADAAKGAAEGDSGYGETIAQVLQRL